MYLKMVVTQKILNPVLGEYREQVIASVAQW